MKRLVLVVGLLFGLQHYAAAENAVVPLSDDVAIDTGVETGEDEMELPTCVLNLNEHTSLDHAVLLTIAKAAMANAYAPYSQFQVGAALLGESGRVYTGCNVENASYGATMCAERVAIFKGVAEGERNFVAVAIVSSGGDFTYPCGMCRQVLGEFNLDMTVILEGKNSEVRVHSLRELLPHAFTGAALHEADLEKI